MTAEISEYKGNKVISLREDDNDRFPFTFGYRKAVLILNHIDDIEKFVDEIEAGLKKDEGTK